MFAHLQDRDFLVRNLCFLQKLIVASAPLLLFARERCRGDLREYYDQHLEEEVGHDTMLAEDLHKLGCSVIPPCHTAASIAGSQYYLVAHEHPALLLGYMLVLESNPMPMEVVEDLERVHGVWLDSLRHHSLHDEAHGEMIKAMIAQTGGHLQERIMRNAELVKVGLNGVTQRLVDKVEVV